jgi:hypothetical protein
VGGVAFFVGGEQQGDGAGVVGWAATKASMAVTKAASEDFMSAAPRPKSMPSRSVGSKGFDAQASSGPVGTTSVWPANTTRGRRCRGGPTGC